MKTTNGKPKGPNPEAKTKRTQKAITFVADLQNQLLLDKARAAGFDINQLISRCVQKYIESQIATEELIDAAREISKLKAKGGAR